MHPGSLAGSAAAMMQQPLPGLFPPMPGSSAAAPGAPPPEMPAVSYDDALLDKYREVDKAIRKNDERYLSGLLREPAEEKAKGVNLSRDPLLSVVIAYEKTELAKWLAGRMAAEDLLAGNESGETALHAAAAQGDIYAAEAIVERFRHERGGVGEVVEARNKQQETALHKAALYGKREMFWFLHDSLGGDVYARGWEGASVLHCAIMGNAFDLALEMVRKYPFLRYSRNLGSVTPLQLMVTIPKAFKSTQYYGPLDSIIYRWIPSEEDMSISEPNKADEENQMTHGSSQHVEEEREKEHNDSFCRNLPQNYQSCCVLLEIFSIPAKWIQVLLFNVLKQVFSKFGRLERQKRKHVQAMKLVELMAKDEKYWDFLMKGRTPQPQKQTRSRNKDIGDLGDNIHQALQLVTDSTREEKYLNFITRRWMSRSENGSLQRDEKYKLGNVIYQVVKLISLLAREEKYSEHHTKEMMPKINESESLLKDENIHSYGDGIYQYDEQDENTTRWDDSPLILGARMGLHEFVKQILMVRPETALWLDVQGKNVLQVAIENGHGRIVEIVKRMAMGNNPRLPTSILSSREDKTKNTILHFAAKKTVNEEEATALQMQYELQWFEKVRQLLPKDLWNSRNNSEKTAQELFNENHKEMVKKCKEQVVEMGKTGSGILAAVVFASGFSIPGERQSNNAPSFHNRTAFKVFANAYVIGLSCASTAMVLFLSLLTSSYRQRDFRHSVPTKYFFATLSFFFALVALLVSFSCSIYLNIYGYRKSEPKDIIPFVCELTIFPAVCFFVLLYRGTTFGLGPFFRHVLQ